MRAGAQRGHAVAALGLEVGRPGEAGDVGGARRGDGGLLVGASRAHLDQRASGGRADHARGGGGDRRVVVEDRQRQRLEHHAFGECAVHRQHGGAGEVQLAFGVAVDVAAEPEVGEVRERVGVEEVARVTPTPSSSNLNCGNASRSGRCRRPRRSGGPRGAGGRTPRTWCDGARCRRAAPPPASSARTCRSTGQQTAYGHTATVSVSRASVS